MSDHIPTSLRQQIYERAGGQCEYCLMPEVAVLMSLEVDHIIARKHGGKIVADNLALSCSLCNKHKGSDLTSNEHTSTFLLLDVLVLLLILHPQIVPVLDSKLLVRHINRLSNLLVFQKGLKAWISELI